jgi:hypothetical protein
MATHKENARTSALTPYGHTTLHLSISIDMTNIQAQYFGNSATGREQQMQQRRIPQANQTQAGSAIMLGRRTIIKIHQAA